MEPRFLLSLVLLVVIFNPSLVLNMVLGYVVGALVRKNITRLKMMILGIKNEEEEDDVVEVKNPCEGVYADVMKHLKTLGLDLKVEDDDVEYLRRFWESMISKK
ncbi:U4 protein [Milk vetch chlorotic dwarf virus]|uniref:U4 protein n=1 Tax=Milk vetch chlorotic dwarf virus TaxID=2683340 RepID=A0A650FYR0_9VIRU|nr:U4 protein [Milk vetch chlorotic dwarf virus]